MTRLRLVAVTVVVLIVVVTIASLGKPNGPAGRSSTPTAAAPDDGAFAAVTSSTSPTARVAQPSALPELKDRAPQRDVAQDAPSVRSYERTHRLLNATPITYAGVTFDTAGRTGSGRVRITGDGFGLPEPTVRDAYRRLLRHLRDRGRAYHLTVIAPVAQAP